MNTLQAPDVLVLKRVFGRTQEFETIRGKEILNTPHNRMGENGFWYYNPRTLEPLTDDCEKAMDQMGPAGYLEWLCRNYGVQLSSMPQTEWECELAAREVVRSLPNYTGEKYIQ